MSQSQVLGIRTWAYLWRTTTQPTAASYPPRPYGVASPPLQLHSQALLLGAWALTTLAAWHFLEDELFPVLFTHAILSLAFA